jgi:hypothetical protein
VRLATWLALRVLGLERPFVKLPTPPVVDFAGQVRSGAPQALCGWLRVKIPVLDCIGVRDARSLRPPVACPSPFSGLYLAGDLRRSYQGGAGRLARGNEDDCWCDVSAYLVSRFPEARALLNQRRVRIIADTRDLIHDVTICRTGM